MDRLLDELARDLKDGSFAPLPARPVFIPKPGRRRSRNQSATANSLRCCGTALVGNAANGRSKIYRYYTCKTRSRYGTDGCNNHRLPADDVDETVFVALARFHRHHTDVIADAARDHDAGAGEMRAEYTAVEKQLTRPTTGIDRYLQDFENGELNTADLMDPDRRAQGEDPATHRSS